VRRAVLTAGAGHRGEPGESAVSPQPLLGRPGPELRTLLGPADRLQEVRVPTPPVDDGDTAHTRTPPDFATGSRSPRRSPHAPRTPAGPAPCAAPSRISRKYVNCLESRPNCAYSPTFPPAYVRPRFTRPGDGDGQPARRPPGRAAHPLGRGTAAARHAGPQNLQRPVVTGSPQRPHYRSVPRPPSASDVSRNGQGRGAWGPGPEACCDRGNGRTSGAGRVQPRVLPLTWSGPK
jgi:hypothetical protein